MYVECFYKLVKKTSTKMNTIKALPLNKKHVTKQVYRKVYKNLIKQTNIASDLYLRMRDLI